MSVAPRISPHRAFLWVTPVAALAFVVVLFLKELTLRDKAHVGMEAVREDLGVTFETAIESDTVPELVVPSSANPTTPPKR